MVCPTVPIRMYSHADDPLEGDSEMSTPEPVATAQNETVGQETCPK
jgi:hypothetical protein